MSDASLPSSQVDSIVLQLFFKMVQFSFASLFCIVCITFTFCAPIEGANNNATVTGVKLQNRQKYKICSVANGLCMTAEEGIYDEELGPVLLEEFKGFSAQKWTYILSHRQASAFVSGEHRYNNVTTFHKKNSYHVYNEFRAIEMEIEGRGVVYVLKQSGFETNKDKPECLEQKGIGEPVQLLACDELNPDQRWAFEHLPSTSSSVTP